jgi:hypothetical protein
MEPETTKVGDLIIVYEGAKNLTWGQCFCVKDIYGKVCENRLQHCSDCFRKG